MSFRILIVEDDFTSRTLLLRALERYGPCEVAVDGDEAITAFTSAHQQKSPYSLLMLDLIMPKKAGLDVLKEIRSFEESLGIQGRDGTKVVVTTGAEGHEVLFNSFRSGCEAFLRKPVDISALNRTLAELNIGAL